MASAKSTRGKSWLAPLFAALLLIAIGAATFWGAFQLARSGLLDSILGTPLPPATSTPPAQASHLPTQSVAPSPTERAVTATLQATESPTPTILPATATSTPSATLTSEPTVTSTATDRASAGSFRVEYEGCISHGSGIGTVKGVVYDRKGGVIPGAVVRITLDGYPYDQPAISNSAGWYEFYLEKGLKVQIVSLEIQGREVPLLGQEQEFESQGGCFEHVNLRQQ